MADAVSRCVHCGFCLAACPTYQELGQEMDSPRGRITLMKEVLEGNLDWEAARPHVDRCLGCLACEPACPSGVPYRDLISPFRAAAEVRWQRPLSERFLRLLVGQTLPYPERFRWAARLGQLGKFLGIPVPRAWRPMMELLPNSLPPAQVLARSLLTVPDAPVWPCWRDARSRFWRRTSTRRRSPFSPGTAWRCCFQWGRGVAADFPGTPATSPRRGEFAQRNLDAFQ